MKKYFLYVFLFLVFIFIIVTYEYIFHIPQVNLLPGRYHLKKQQSIVLFTHKFTIYKINDSIRFKEIKSFPKSWELTKKGYIFLKWKKFDSNKDDIIPYIKNLINDCSSCNGKAQPLQFLKQLQEEKSNFLYSKIGLRIFNTDKIDASYFYFINEETHTLYAFEALPHM